jgi:NAD(P)-dependent dehydrogenase (short-subunit alcohol dehydrogenase family)
MAMLQGKVILITGASRGIGAVAARLFAAEGAQLVLGARNDEPLQAVARELREGGAEVAATAADVATREGSEILVDAAVRHYGRLDGAFDNAAAGHPPPGPLTSIDEAFWDEVNATNLRGVWLSLRAQIPALIASGGGAIVINGSLGGLVGGFGDAAYQASKHGVTGLVRAATAEFGSKGVRVNAVAPNITRTEDVSTFLAQRPEAEREAVRRTPLGRLATAEDVAEAAAWLLSDRSAYVAGVTLPVDGGMVAVRI